MHYSIFGEEIPEGKVHRRLEADFINETSLPGWLTSFGGTTTTLTHNDVSTGRGDLDVQVDNAKGGLTGPEIDITAFREVRFGVAVQSGLTATNLLVAEWADGSGGTTKSNYISMNEAPSDSRATLALKESGTSSSKSLNFDWDHQTAPAIIEVRLRNYDKSFSIVAGDGEQVIHEEGGLGYDNGNMFPQVWADTSNEATIESFQVSKAWVDLIHN